MAASPSRIEDFPEIERVEIYGLKAAKSLYDFINNEALPGTGVDQDHFWRSFAQIINEFSPQNAALLEQRDRHQAALDQWHKKHPGVIADMEEYKNYLRMIGYMLDEVPDFKVQTTRIDPEIGQVAGPQLVTPVTIEQFATNAANNRWARLYDSFYGTDALGRAPTGDDFHPIPGTQTEDSKGIDESHGRKVIAEVRSRLDGIAPLTNGLYSNVKSFAVENGELTVTMLDGTKTGLAQPEKFAGYRGTKADPFSILLVNNGLHVDIKIDHGNPIGKIDKAGIAEVEVEAAMTTIMDLEDAVATVDASDKVHGYRNWLGLMKGTLTAQFPKYGRMMTRRMNGDREYHAPNGKRKVLKGRSLMMIRNVGISMPSTDCIFDEKGIAVPENIIDAMVTSLIGKHDLISRKNSQKGSIYIVNPKMHGHEDVEFKVNLSERIEDALDMPRNTIKMGIMDEERRMTVNLKRAIRAAKKRIFFINTGFLDRIGCEIHTSTYAGPMLPKEAIRGTRTVGAYEDRNVDTGLAAGLPGHAQTGKGMFAKPDNMKEMLEVKIGHPRAGADTAWVPNTVASALHALHYHMVDVHARQKELLAGGPRTTIDEILTPPLMTPEQRAALTPEIIQREIDNNVQGILGYVVRWVNSGIGCSKVPDITDTNLMEDRATLRISSQHLANWLLRGICTQDQVLESMKRMALKVDEQNIRAQRPGDPPYRRLADEFDGPAFQAARDLVFHAIEQPDGYTEAILYRGRREVKAAMRLAA